PAVLAVRSGLRGLAERVPLQCDQGNLHGSCLLLGVAHAGTPRVAGEAVRMLATKCGLRLIQAEAEIPGPIQAAPGKISMASTPLQPRQTAWGRACVVDTASNITPQTGRCQACRAHRRVARPAAGRPRPGRGPVAVSRNTVTIRPS